jgi:hypothetical protein
MAVCGRCWVCETKFLCGAMPCSKCAPDGNKPVSVPAVDRTICHDCVELIEEGVVGKLIDSIHALRVKGKPADRIARYFEEHPETKVTGPFSVTVPVASVPWAQPAACPTCKIPVEDLIADHVDDCLPIANPARIGQAAPHSLIAKLYQPAGLPCLKCGKDAKGAVFVQLCAECLRDRTPSIPREVQPPAPFRCKCEGQGCARCTGTLL